MLQSVTAYLFTVVFFLALDYVWLARLAKGFYIKRLGELLLPTPRFGIAALFYIVYVVGIVIFAVTPALREGSMATAALYGALFGFFAYATYDITNYATLRDWPLAVAIVDIAWGTVLTGLSAVVGYLAAEHLIQA